MSKEQIKLTNTTKGVMLELNGEKTVISKMICLAMIKDQEFASLISAAIPTFLDVKKIDRKDYCNIIMTAKGNKA